MVNGLATAENWNRFPLARPRQFGSLVLLRWTLLAALAFLLNAEAGPEGFLGYGGLVLASMAVVNSILLASGPSIAARPAFTLLLTSIDTIAAAMIIFQSGADGADLLFVFGLVVFLVALGHEMKKIVAETLVLSALYLWLGSHYRPEETVTVWLARVAFLYTIGIYFGYLVVEIRTERERKGVTDKDRREMRTILDILETANSTLDLHKVMATIVGKICEVIETDRCSVLFLDRDPDRGWVLASSDSPDLDMLPVDLRKYPEVREAMRTRTSITVDDVETHPLMLPVREQIRSSRFSSLLVIPLIFQDEMLGTLLLRAANRNGAFGADELRFCQTVAGASVSALKNAMLYRQIRMESDRHRSTAEKLRNILENSMDIILTTDTEGRITDFNRSAETALGYSRTDIVGRPITDLLGVDMERRDFLARLRRAGTVLEESTSIRRADGKRMDLDMTFAIVRNDLGEMVGAVCVGKDPIHAN
jgi:PAS domain S-box-containing protein